jgi:hypothetical protein
VQRGRGPQHVVHSGEQRGGGGLGDHRVLHRGGEEPAVVAVDVIGQRGGEPALPGRRHHPIAPGDDHGVADVEEPGSY